MSRNTGYVETKCSNNVFRGFIIDRYNYITFKTELFLKKDVINKTDLHPLGEAPIAYFGHAHFTGQAPNLQIDKGLQLLLRNFRPEFKAAQNLVIELVILFSSFVFENSFWFKRS
jgi:hypothetical protein